MPLLDISHSTNLSKFGFRKVWSFDAGNQHYDIKPDTFGDVTYEDYILCQSYNEGGGETGRCPSYLIN